MGSKKTVSALFNEHLNANRKEKDPSDRKVVLMFLVPIALIVAAFLFAYIRKHPMEKTPSVLAQDLEGCSYIDPECGTIWASSAVIWAVALGFGVALVPWWGVGASLKALGATTVPLLANIYLNPKNPLKRFQMPEEAQPTLVELEFAAEAYNQLRAAFPEDGHSSLK